MGLAGYISRLCCTLLSVLLLVHRSTGLEFDMLFQVSQAGHPPDAAAPFAWQGFRH